MPPKKQPDKKEGKIDEPVSYNINAMSLDQLKQYARLLEGEIEEMRNHCNFYKKSEDELVELLRIAKENLKYDEDVLLIKDTKIEKMKLNFLKNLHEKRQLPKYLKYSSSEKKAKLSCEIFYLLKEEQNRHTSEAQKLKFVLQEKNRQVEALEVKIEMGRRKSKERNEEILRDMGASQRNVLEQAIKKYGHMKTETETEFKLALEMSSIEARESKIKSIRNFNDVCISFKQKLQNYYKESTQQDLEFIKKLKNDIAEVEESIKKSKSILEKIKKEKKKWNEKSKFKIENRVKDIAPKLDAGPYRMMEAFKTHNKMEKLAVENQKLENQIKDMTDKKNNLKKHFTTALGKVRDSAEMKVKLLDRKMNTVLDGGEKETDVDFSVFISHENAISDENVLKSETPYSDTFDISKRVFM